MTAAVFEPHSEAELRRHYLQTRNRLRQMPVRKLPTRALSVAIPIIAVETKTRPDPAPWISEVRKVQVAVCRHYGVELVDLCSARRTADIVRPRQVAMYLAKKLTLSSLPEIGRRTGNRDHTTAIWAIRKIEKLIQTDEGLAATVATITKALRP